MTDSVARPDQSPTGDSVVLPDDDPAVSDYSFQSFEGGSGFDGGYTTEPPIVIVADSLAHGQSATEATLTARPILLVDSFAQAQQASQSELQQGYTLATDGVQQSQQLNAPALLQTFSLAVNAASQSQIAPEAQMLQRSTLTVHAARQASIAPLTYLIMQGDITPIPVTQTVNTNSPSMVQWGRLSIGETRQSQKTAAVSLTAKHTISANTLEQIQFAPGAVLQQVLISDRLGQAQLLAGGDLETSKQCLVFGLTQTQTLQQSRLSGLSVSYLEGTVLVYPSIEAEPHIFY